MTVQDVPCRTCQAPPSSPCATRSGRLRTSAHRTRHLDYARTPSPTVEERILAYVTRHEEMMAEVADGAHRVAYPYSVWCDHHSEIHEAEYDVYEESGYRFDGTPTECNPANWRRVYIATDDPDEEF